MSIRTKLILLAGLMLTGVVAALLTRDPVRSLGTLSRKDVVEIRSVVTQSEAPGWSSLKGSEIHSWPSLALQRITFRIVDIREDSVRGVTFHSDGTREERPRVLVRCKAVGRKPKTSTLAKQNGRWTFISAPTIFYPD